MTNYGKYFSTRQTPQSQPIPGTTQVPNSAGGFAWQVDDWTRLDRFLILGSEGGTYYITPKELTVGNAQAALRCIKADGKRVVDRIVEISQAGRAPKNDPALYILAMAIGEGDVETRKYAAEKLPQVARIATHLFQFINYTKAFRGWGRVLRTAVGDWYNSMQADRLAYQIVKYRNREGWAHRDMLRVSHPEPATPIHDSLYQYVTKDEWDKRLEYPTIIQAYELANEPNIDKAALINLIREHNLPREAIPNHFFNDAEVWGAMLENMPLTAMIRNLGKMSQVGLLKPLSGANRMVVDKLTNSEQLRRARVHPLNLMLALKTYTSGQGFKGNLSWTPVPQIISALDTAFHASFQYVEPSGKNYLIGLDVSPSMSYQIPSTPLLSSSEAGAAMALTVANTEPNYHVMKFTHQFSECPITAGMRLDAAVRIAQNSSGWGGTDCAMPMIYATSKGLDVDMFVVITDNETWAGNIHPVQALAEYRRVMSKPQAKLVVIGMTSNGFSIADPNDAGMLDVVGFDTTVPAVVSDFARGE